MTPRQLIESQGRKPVLGWIDQRRKPLDLNSTDVRQTWAAVKRLETIALSQKGKHGSL